jgi:hypothetical protein
MPTYDLIVDESQVPPHEPLALPRRGSASDRRSELLRQGALDLQERKFGAQLQRDAHRLSIAEEQVLLEKTRQLERLAALRFRLEKERYATRHAVALITKLGDLEESDPKFEQKWARLLAEHAPGADSKVAQQVITAKRDSWLSHQKALELRALSSFAPGPAQEAYTQALSETGDAGYANRVAEGQQKLFERWKAAYVSPHLPEKIRQQLRDENGRYRYDALDDAEIEIGKMQAAQGASTEQLRPLSILTKSREAVAKYAAANPDDASARESLDALDKAMIRSANGLATTAPAPGDDYVSEALAAFGESDKPALPSSAAPAPAKTPPPAIPEPDADEEEEL